MKSEWFAWLKESLQPDSLRYLAHYLTVLSSVMLLLTLVLEWRWQLALPQRLLWLLLPMQFMLTLAAYVWAARVRRVRVSAYLAVLLSSTLMLGWFLHDSGGHTNPLISLLLVPVAMSAALLGWQATLSVAALALALYGGMMRYFEPLVSTQSGGLQNFMQLHLMGMWLTFVLSVALLIGLVLPMAAAVRRQRDQIAAQREQMLRDERLVAMATFAASAAHQLGTPLSTLAVLVDDLQAELKSAEAAEDLRTMAGQIDLCKYTLQSMMRRAEDIRQGVKREEPVGGFIERLREQFSLLHPARVLRLGQADSMDRVMQTDDTLDQAILNLLDNSARVSSEDPVIHVMGHDMQLCLRIIDNGPGIPEAIGSRLGQPYVSGREGGIGLGLFLSHATINRFGGTLQLTSTKTGTLTEILLPVQAATGRTD